MSISFAILGVAAALLGGWQIKLGHRASMMIGSLCYGGGFMLTGLAI